jgi:hypothetical protein
MTSGRKSRLDNEGAYRRDPSLEYGIKKVLFAIVRFQNVLVLKLGEGYAGIIVEL